MKNKAFEDVLQNELGAKTPNSFLLFINPLNWNACSIIIKPQCSQNCESERSYLMENKKTFGRILISKRQENEISARQLAIALDYSAVYICDIEKDRRPVPDEILEKLPTLLHLNETETDEMYDLAAKSRNTVSADLPEYIMEKDIVRAALRTAKKNNVTDKQWEDFIRRITKESY